MSSNKKRRELNRAIEEHEIAKLASSSNNAFNATVWKAGAEKLQADNDQLRSELATIKAENESLRKDAERWRTMSALMFLGNVECTQDADGGYRIELDPAENMLGVSWEGNSPEEAIDAAMAQGEK